MTWQPAGCVCLNGEIVPAAEARVGIFDHGLLYGDGLFETCRAYGGRIFRLDAHLARLEQGARVLNLTLPWSRDSLVEAVYRTLAANNLLDAVLRLTVTRGEGPPVPDPSVCAAPTFFIAARPWAPIPPAAYEAGYRAVIAESVRQNSASPFSRLKSLNFGLSQMARGEARTRGADEALLLNEHGRLAEGSVTNLFAVLGSRLVTPPPAEGCLPGVTRAAVLELAPSVGLAAEETTLTPDELARADEAFLTNSALEIMPLTRLGDRPVGTGIPGTVTARLMAAYGDLVRLEVYRASK